MRTKNKIKTISNTSVSLVNICLLICSTVLPLTGSLILTNIKETFGLNKVKRISNSKTFSISRDKRYILIAIRPILTYVLKIAVPLALGATLVSDQVTIGRLNNEMKSIKSSVLQTTRLLADPDIEITFELVESILTTLELKQREKGLMQSISEYANQLQNQFENIRLRYLNLDSIKPYDALNIFLRTLKENQPEAGIPDVGHDIFKFATPVKGLMDNGIETLEFLIPIVNEYNLHIWNMYSVPDEDGYIYRLSNNRFYQKLILTPDNHSYVDITNLDFTSRIISKPLVYLSVDRCMNSILMSSTDDDTCVHSKELCSNLEQIFSIETDKVFSITGCKNHTRIVCNSHNELITHPAAIVSFPKCGILNSHQNIWSQHHRSRRDIGDNLPYRKISSPIFEDVRLPAIRLPKGRSKEFKKIADDLERSLNKNNSESFLGQYINHLLIFVFIIVGISILIFKVLIPFLKPRKPEERWLANWQGPPSQMSHP
ncbi:hypothetical protein ACFFRR_005819 [Megaselia abdita]